MQLALTLLQNMRSLYLNGGTGTVFVFAMVYEKAIITSIF